MSWLYGYERSELMEPKAVIAFRISNGKAFLKAIRESPLGKLWNSPEMKKLRADHLALNFKDWPYCERCTTWSLLNWNYDYGKALKSVLED